MWWSTWVSNPHSLSYFQSNHPVAIVLVSTLIAQWMSKIRFQDGGYCRHPGFLISKLSYTCTFDLQVILLLQCKSKLKSSKCSGADVKNQFSSWQLLWLFWIFNQHDFSYFHMDWSACCSIISFKLIRRGVCKEISKIDFKDDCCCGSHLGLLIGTILAIFDPEVFLLLQSKFQI